jgi:murein DD-endopeptidase MepM/ murein hydrolase activator NlpD
VSNRFSRRALTFAAAAAIARPPSATPAQEQAAWAWVYPMGRAGDVPGNGLYMRHAFATENTSFYPGGWHTGENYYLLEGESAGAEVYAASDGEIVYAGFDYPGPVVIIRHANDLYSMYGHLDYALDVDSGPVRRGQRLGTVLYRTDGRSPSHLHFEIRRFLTTPEVNGATPRYSFTCGTNCPPGPGYWPIDAQEHPVGMGWLNPLHAMAVRSFPDGIPPGGVEVMVAEDAPPAVDTYPAPEGDSPNGTIDLDPGMRFRLTGIEAGDEETTETSAEAYRLWYEVLDPERDAPVWLRALEPSDDALGSDGRPSSLRFNLLPAIEVAAE